MFCGEVKDDALVFYGQMGVGHILQSCIECLLDGSYYCCSLCGVLTNKSHNGMPDECTGPDPFVADFHPLKAHKWAPLTQADQMEIYQ